MARKARGGVLAFQVALPLAALLSIFLLVVSLPNYFDQRSQICPSPCEIYGGITEADRPRLEAIGLTLSGYAGYLTVLQAISSLSVLVISVVIALRRWHDRPALLIALLLVLMGLSVSVEPEQFGLPGWLWGLAGAAQAISVLLFFFLFPDGRFVPGWTRWALIAWLLVNSTRFFPDSALDLSRYEVLDAAQWFLIMLLAMGSQFYRYRWVSESVQRQQTKWVVVGTWIWVLISLPLALSGPSPGSLVFLLLETLSAALLWLLSISIAIAMLRYRLWDVDLLIRRTLIYSILTGLLALTFFGSVAILDSLLVSISGPRSQIATVLSTLGIAALFTPLQRRVQNLIDRRFYRRKYDAEKALASFGRELREEIDLENLTHALLMVVQDTLEPTHVTCWLRTPTDDR